MKRLIHIALMGVLVLGVASLAAGQAVVPQEHAQGREVVANPVTSVAPQPVVRLGNFLEVGNDVFMHIIATVEARYRTTENEDFDKHVRDRAHGRQPDSATTYDWADNASAQVQLGVDVRYQKNLQLYLIFRETTIFDGNTIDDRANCTNPGGTDVFGRVAETENPGFRAERYWIDYKFGGTPLRLRVGADSWTVDQAGTVGDDDPRIALFGTFGNFDVMAAAVYQLASTRIGLVNDNNYLFYTFSAGYNLRPHRFQFDVVYFRDRFFGADAATPPIIRGQKIDNALLMASWSGSAGPVRGLVQGMVNLGNATGGNALTPAQLAVPGTANGKDYDIFSYGAVAYADVDLGVVRPFIGVVYGSPDRNPSDTHLRGFAPSTFEDVTLITATPWFSQLDTSSAFARRDYACPARLGTPVAGSATTNGYVGATPLIPAKPGTPVTAQNIGVNVLAERNGGNGCIHSESNPFNQRVGSTSHLGISTALSNPGTLNVPIGVKFFPAKGHEITGWYVYRGMINSRLLEVAFGPQLAGKHINNEMYNEIGGYWLWTLNPHFDIRLSGSMNLPGEWAKDIARLADCNTTTAVNSCHGSTTALYGQARFRARF